MEKEVQTLRSHVSLLQQQQVLAEEREGKLSAQLSASIAQYQQLRVLKLEEIDAARALNMVQSSPIMNSRKRSASGAAPAAASSWPPSKDAAAPAKAASAAAPAQAAVIDQLVDQRMSTLPAVQLPSVPIDPSRQITPPEQYCAASMWRSRITEHAEPRVGMPRSVSHDGTLPSVSASANAPVRRGLAATDLAAAPMAANPGMSVRTPFGYVRGAICVEPPKRQRTNQSSTPTASPRPGKAASAPMAPATAAIPAASPATAAAVPAMAVPLAPAVHMTPVIPTVPAVAVSEPTPVQV
uniref:Uncharacterized protein n=1 Tax=Haptolina ericina TaxID=156174 RepID=A0A7S3BYN2_9EUKA